MAKMLGIGIWTTGTTLALFYYTLDFFKNHINGFKKWAAPSPDIYVQMLAVDVFVVSAVILIISWLASKTKWGIKTGSSLIVIGSLLICASLVIPPNQMRQHMDWILFGLGAAYATWGTICAYDCAKKLGSTEMFFLAYAFTQILIMTSGTTLIFLTTIPPLKF